jgi:hypothetical protein
MHLTLSDLESVVYLVDVARTDRLNLRRLHFGGHLQIAD